MTGASVYTSGLYFEKINDAVGDASDPRHFKLVAMAIKPYEQQNDVAWKATGRRGAEFQSPDLCAMPPDVPGVTAFNDGLNKTVKTSTIVSEYFFRDADA